MADNIKEQIESLKKERNAVILAHNYQLPEVQDIADFTGDSLELAKKVINIKEKTIVFCGVYFMAETAAILNPDKAVIIPEKEADCPMARMATAEKVREWRSKYPDYTFVAYINTTADTKAEVDICCTSANAEKIIRKVENNKIVFLPDKNLGEYVREKVGEKDIVLWPGYCHVHEFASVESLEAVKKNYPDAVVLAHPECNKDIREKADEICSTGQMFKIVEKYANTQEFIIMTEWGMVYALSRRFPDKKFIEPMRRMECYNMKKIDLKSVLRALETGEYVVKVPNEVAEKVKEPILRMLDLN